MPRKRNSDLSSNSTSTVSSSCGTVQTSRQDLLWIHKTRSSTTLSHSDAAETARIKRHVRQVRDEEVIVRRTPGTRKRRKRPPVWTWIHHDATDGSTAPPSADQESPDRRDSVTSPTSMTIPMSTLSPLSSRAEAILRSPLGSNLARQSPDANSCFAFFLAYFPLPTQSPYDGLLRRGFVLSGLLDVSLRDTGVFQAFCYYIDSMHMLVDTEFNKIRAAARFRQHAYTALLMRLAAGPSENEVISNEVLVLTMLLSYSATLTGQYDEFVAHSRGLVAMVAARQKQGHHNLPVGVEACNNLNSVFHATVSPDFDRSSLPANCVRMLQAPLSKEETEALFCLPPHVLALVKRNQLSWETIWVMAFAQKHIFTLIDPAADSEVLDGAELVISDAARSPFTHTTLTVLLLCTMMVRTSRDEGVKLCIRAFGGAVIREGIPMYLQVGRWMGMMCTELSPECLIGWHETAAAVCHEISQHRLWQPHCGTLAASLNRVYPPATMLKFWNACWADTVP